jgi:hypothetical protein
VSFRAISCRAVQKHTTNMPRRWASWSAIIMVRIYLLRHAELVCPELSDESSRCGTRVDWCVTSVLQTLTSRSVRWMAICNNAPMLLQCVERTENAVLAPANPARHRWHSQLQLTSCSGDSTHGTLISESCCWLQIAVLHAALRICTRTACSSTAVHWHAGPKRNELSRCMLV